MRSLPGVLLLCACSSSPSKAGPDAAVDAPDVDASTQLAFAYAPGWAGVQSVAVIGGFGQASDWTAPLVTLTDDGSGMFTGAATLPPGTYPYLFEVTGDTDAGAKAATAQHLAIDPAQPATSRARITSSRTG